jgi:hypothetical protein
LPLATLTSSAIIKGDSTSLPVYLEIPLTW